jgi:hypothetical protein
MEKSNYKKLSYGQYFTDTSRDECGKTGVIHTPVTYKSIVYEVDGIKYEANYDVEYDESRNCIQCFFEDTSGRSDWITNFTFVDKYYDKFKDPETGKWIQLRVHMGWARMYKVMKYEVREAVKNLLNKYPDAEVEIIGWSLGSGMAQLCAQDLNYNFGIKSHLFTYGSVNPFKVKLFTKRKIIKYLRNCCKEVYCFSHKSDIVTYMVPWIFGFRKIKRINLGKFKFFGLFNPMVYHCEYWKEELYEKVK